MSFIRISRSKDRLFTLLSNKVLTCSNISDAARGFWARCICLDCDVEFIDKNEEILANELVNAGYAEKINKDYRFKND